jgi:N-dimethylarginine dimethylaminohydrolase
MTVQSEVRPLTRCLISHSRDAWSSAQRVSSQWQRLGYGAKPDLEAALSDSDAFAQVLADHGVGLDYLPADQNLTLDALYPRDAAIATDRGMILCRMGKGARSGEPAHHRAFYQAQGIPIAGEIEAPGTLEGGDVAWLDQKTLAVGRGYRTNDTGIAQLGAILGSDTDLVVVPLPHYRGPEDVFHLMSIFSPVDTDLALVYSPLMPVPFRERLCVRGYQLVEVPDEEFEMGCNVLALAPRVCLAAEGYPRTKRLLEQAGAVVHTYPAGELSEKGHGGPTCLTRPLSRS